jgi:hypothetical protein
MSADRWRHQIEIEGETYELEFIKRPFREGLEVRVETRFGAISVAELGLGELALIERVKAEILRRSERDNPKDGL